MGLQFQHLRLVGSCKKLLNTQLLRLCVVGILHLGSDNLSRSKLRITMCGTTKYKMLLVGLGAMLTRRLEQSSTVRVNPNLKLNNGKLEYSSSASPRYLVNNVLIHAMQLSILHFVFPRDQNMPLIFVDDYKY